LTYKNQQLVLAVMKAHLSLSTAYLIQFRNEVLWFNKSIDDKSKVTF